MIPKTTKFEKTKEAYKNMHKILTNYQNFVMINNYIENDIGLQNRYMKVWSNSLSLKKSENLEAGNLFDLYSKSYNGYRYDAIVFIFSGKVTTNTYKFCVEISKRHAKEVNENNDFKVRHIDIYVIGDSGTEYQIGNIKRQFSIRNMPYFATEEERIADERRAIELGVDSLTSYYTVDIPLREATLFPPDNPFFPRHVEIMRSRQEQQNLQIALTRDEVTKNMTLKEMIPLICWNDPVCRVYGAKVGDVIHTISNTQFNPDYRYVISTDMSF